MADWMDLKKKGNQYYKSGNFHDSIGAYSEALELETKLRAKDRCILLKNRAAAYLKIDNFKLALADCDAALQMSPGDIKALYRRSQALEGDGRLAEALQSLKTVLVIDASNEEALAYARRLTEAIRRQSELTMSTSEKVKDMFTALKSDDVKDSLKVQAARNFAILSRESSGQKELLNQGGVAELVKILRHPLDQVVHHILQTLVGLCGSGPDVATDILGAVTLDRLASMVKHNHKEVSSSAVALLSAISSSLTSSLAGEQRVAAIEMMMKLLVDVQVGGSARDALLQVITSTLPHGDSVGVYLNNGLLENVLQLSGDCHMTSEGDHVTSDDGEVPIGEDTHINIVLLLAKLSEHVDKDMELKERYQSECRLFIVERLREGAVEGGLSALAVVLQASTEVASQIFSEEVVMEKAIEMANSKDTRCQAIAAEVFSLAASNKTRCEGILQKALPSLKHLYSSSSDEVKVRALVGLCRIGSVGGSNVNARTFTDGATLKLERMCRKFLIGTKKDRHLQKWSVEGLAFLSLDAEVKEALVGDKTALQTLYRCAKNVHDYSQVYAIATILVNVSNSYDKPEKNPELEELGKYAGENVPQEHELDAETYIRKRVKVLLEGGVVGCLVEMTSLQSSGIDELVSRVLLAVCEEMGHRGAVIQQGGVKALISLATANNTAKGKLIAAQALAKIGITNDPRLAFPGQRSLEVIRPIVQLLKSEHGLQQFEGLMALTNLAGMAEDTRRRIHREGAVPLMESLMFEEHELIRRAATEALCNMLSVPEVQQRFHADDIERVKLWTLFSGEEDEKLALAASGGLAQLTHDPKLCEKVMEVKSSFEILKELLGHSNPDLQYRGVYILTNLVMANSSIAQKIVESDFLEIFMALAQAPATPERIKLCVNKALSSCVEYGFIKPNN